MKIYTDEIPGCIIITAPADGSISIQKMDAAARKIGKVKVVERVEAGGRIGRAYKITA